LLLVLIGTTAGLTVWLRVAAAGPTAINPRAAPAAFVEGMVTGSAGPLSGARVRIRATDNLTFTNPLGQFTLTGLTPGQRVQVTAWYTGYYIAGAYVTPTVSGLTLTLRPLHGEDDPEYAWTSPITGTSSKACSNCHPMIMSQWQKNAHGQATANARFFSMYDGTNLSGTMVVTPGYRLDFPDTAGNCANCHAPGAAVDGYLTSGMDDVRDVITASIHCDYCHKVGGVYLNPATGSVYANTPGVQSQRVLRPPPGDDIFFGQFDDIPDPDSYLQLYDESQYCAPCHQFSFWNTPVYESFSEWLASPYADEGITCQQCHMPPTGDSYFALPEVGGLPHPPAQIPSHRDVGAADVNLLQQTVTLTLTVRQVGNLVVATVTIYNSGAGHHVPTDYPGRQLLLLLTATDDQGQPLPQVTGPTIPAWGGDEAGRSGTAFAKILQDAASGSYPVVSYWKQSFLVSDNRIPALATDVSSYAFALPPTGGKVHLGARLLFRRLFQETAAVKGWTVPTILMEEQSVTLSLQPYTNVYGPLILSQP
jgi:hypothetical protein